MIREIEIGTDKKTVPSSALFNPLSSLLWSLAASAKQEMQL